MKLTKQPRRPPAEPAETDIQRCAYFLWQEEGRPAGRDLDIWLTAKELARRHVPDRPPRPAPRRPLVN